MEEILQSEVLINKYKKVVAALAKKRANAYSKTHTLMKEDLYQEGILGIVKGMQHLVNNDNVTTAWQLASAQMRNYIRAVTGFKMRSEDSDHSKLFDNSVEVAVEEPEERDDENGAPKVYPSVEQPSLVQKDLLEKLRDLGLKILSGPEFSAVFDFDAEPENKALANQNRYRGINKLEKAVENWK